MQETDYTRHYIAEALLKLMKAKDFRDITVTEIVKRAGVGRATFYRYFTDKESVIVYYFNRLNEKFNENIRYIPRCDEDYYDVIRSVLKMLHAYQDFVLLLQASHLEYLYLEYLNRSFQRDFAYGDKPQAAYLSYAYAGMVYNVSMQWVKDDCAEPLEAVADTLFIACFNYDRFRTLKEKKN